MNKNLIVIAGPTAVGKTKLSIQLAKYYNCQIISADSRQFFKEITIGTAKPTLEEMEGIVHYFINNKSIDETYNIGEYEKEVILLLDKLYLETETIILVGGSGLYINAVLNGLDDFENIPTNIRENLIIEFKKNGIIYLQEELKLKDPIYYQTVDLNNPQRLMRALEVCNYTNKPFSEYRTQSKKTRNFNAIPLLINMERNVLYERINNRVDEMVRFGLVEEVKSLIDKKQLNALNTVGYKEIISYLDNEISLSEAINLIKQNTRRYAKRQLTWFKNQGEFELFEPTELEKIKSYINIIIENS